MSTTQDEVVLKQLYWSGSWRAAGLEECTKDRILNVKGPLSSSLAELCAVQSSGKWTQIGGTQKPTLEVLSFQHGRRTILELSSFTVWVRCSCNCFLFVEDK